MIRVEHKEKGDSGAFYYGPENKPLAQMVYVMTGNNKMSIQHTEVDDSLKGKGVGKHLLEELVNYSRFNHISVTPLCTFAAAEFKKNTEWQDVLENKKTGD